MSAYDPKQTSKARQSGRQEDYFFTLDLLGGEPVWQVLHGLPFAILAVACALDIVSEFTASVRENMITVPITVVTIPVFVAGCILPSNLSARGVRRHYCSSTNRKDYPQGSDDLNWP